MIIIDSSCWLEYFAGSRHARSYEKHINKISNILLPTIILYEVFRKILQEKNEDIAIKIIAHMQQAKVIDLDTELSLRAAKYSRTFKLPMADSIIYAAARKHNALIITHDSDFKDLEGVEYYRKN